MEINSTVLSNLLTACFSQASARQATFSHSACLALNCDDDNDTAESAPITARRIAQRRRRIKQWVSTFGSPGKTGGYFPRYSHNGITLMGETIKGLAVLIAMRRKFVTKVKAGTTSVTQIKSASREYASAFS